ncbi:MAG: hypothetical protein Q9214_002965 [Letrouitia sp. 1 TL-2023]
MPPSIRSPSVTVFPEPLSQPHFSPFGIVIECPLQPDQNTIPTSLSSSQNLTTANQNTALKYLDVTNMITFYSSSPSKIPEKAVMNMFSCFPRNLRPSLVPKKHFFDIEILERHPYTTQTFIPIGLQPSNQSSRYLVIVAPTLPSTSDSHFKTMGPPDLKKLKAFWANGRQAVTYSAGTWHAPMVVVGEQRVDFVVTQFANGVADEDCQEVVLEADSIKGGASVAIEVEHQMREATTTTARL